MSTTRTYPAPDAGRRKSRGKRLLNWSLIFLSAFLLVAGTVGYIAIHSRAFYRYVLVKMEKTTDAATGGRTTINHFTIRWSTLTLDLYGLTLHGTELPGSPALLSATHMQIDLTLGLLLRRDINLDAIKVDHLIVHLLVDQEGKTNFPRLATELWKGNNRERINAVGLVIKHFSLCESEIYYNNRQIPITADLNDLQGRIDFNAPKSRYEGALRYRGGLVRFNGYNSLKHNLEVQFSAAPSEFLLRQLHLTSGSSQLSAQGNLKNYRNPVIDGSYQALVSTDTLRNVLKDSSLPLGQMNLEGTLHYQDKPNQPSLYGLVAEGRLHSPAFSLRFSHGRASLYTVSARYLLADGNLNLDGVTANLLDGHLNASLAIQHVDENPEFRTQVEFHALSLQALSASFPTLPLARIPLTGKLNARTTATWRGSWQQLSVRSDATASAKVGVPLEAAISVDATAHLNYDGRHELLSLDESILRTPHTELRFDGTLGEHSSVDVQMHTTDLRELDSIAFDLRSVLPFLRTPQPLRLRGSADFRGRARGSLTAPRIAGELTAANLVVQGTHWRSLRAGINLSPSEMTLQNGSLVSSQHGRVSFEGTLGLQQWEYESSNPLSVRASVEGLSLDEIKQLAGLDCPVHGVLSAQLSASGSLSDLRGRGSAQITRAVLWNQPGQKIQGSFIATGGAVESSITVQTPAGTANGTFAYDLRNKTYTTKFSASGIQLDRLELVSSRDLDLRGVLVLSGHGSGTFEHLKLEAKAEIPELQLGRQTIRGLIAQVNAADQRAEVNISSSLAGSDVQAHGVVDLTGNYNATATLDAHRLPVEPFLTTWLEKMPAELVGQLEIHGQLQGPLKDPARLEAHVQIPNLSLGYRTIQVSNPQPLRIDYRAGLLTLTAARLQGGGGTIDLQATVPVSKSSPLNVSVKGTIDLRVLRAFNQGAAGSGQAAVDLHVRGTRLHPEVEGKIRIIDGTLSTDAFPAGLENVSAEILFEDRRLQFSQFTGQSGGGRFSARGSINYGPQTEFNLGITVSGFRLRYPEGVRTIVNGDLTLIGTPKAASLNGRISIDRLSFTNEFDLTKFLDQFGGPPSLRPSKGFTQNVKVNVSVQSTEELSLSNRTLSLEGSANMRVVGSMADPVLVGRATMTKGELFFQGNRYEIDRGVIDFVNPARTQPVLNMAVTTTVNQYNLSVNFTGPLERLRTTYSSDPPLPPVDIINLLAFGKTPGAATAGSSGPTSLGAESILAQGLAGKASSQIGRLAGISSLTIDPLIGGSQTNPGARLAIQQRVTRNLLLTYSTDVTSTQNEIIQVEYQITKHWSVSATRDRNGGIAVDARWHKAF